jgi:hypothetical protein
MRRTMAPCIFSFKRVPPRTTARQATLTLCQGTLLRRPPFVERRISPFRGPAPAVLLRVVCQRRTAAHCIYRYMYVYAGGMEYCSYS